MAPKDSHKAHHAHSKSIKSALDPIVDSSAPSSFAVLSHAARGIGTSWSGGGERILNEGESFLWVAKRRALTPQARNTVAPLVMTPRFIASASSSSRPSTSSQLVRHSFFSQPKLSFPSLPFQPPASAASLHILEIAPALLAQPVPDSPPPGSSGVSFLRGFQATVSSDKGKERRRKVRGGLAEQELGGKVGVKKLGMKARGLLGAPEEEDEDEEAGEGTMSGKERRRRRREGKKAARGSAVDLSREELLRMEEEIGWDRENLVVRTVSLFQRIVSCHRQLDESHL